MDNDGSRRLSVRDSYASDENDNVLNDTGHFILSLSVCVVYASIKQEIQ